MRRLVEAAKLVVKHVQGHEEQSFIDNLEEQINMFERMFKPSKEKLN